MEANETEASHYKTADKRYISVCSQIIITISYIIGVIGNIIALFILCNSAKIRNRKHTLMLICLASNDLVALCGMLILMYLQLYTPNIMEIHWFCVFRVILRIFGIGSGCVAIVMAFERWLALTRPFLCKQYITYKFIKKSLFYLWTTGAALTCLPFFGFGLYYDQKCLRYRDAKLIQDMAYAYIFFTFGVLLCICIVWCNLCVMKELIRIGSRKRTLVRRISRTISQSGHELIEKHCHPTAEELAFAKLMAILCISFVICWMPQMISIPMAQLGNKSKSTHMFFRIADILMAVHFTLDPYVYVILRFKKVRSQKNVDSVLTLNSKSNKEIKLPYNDISRECI